MLFFVVAVVVAVAAAAAVLRCLLHRRAQVMHTLFSDRMSGAKWSRVERIYAILCSNILKLFVLALACLLDCLCVCVCLFACLCA